jgi:tetratricopeptide (TPR) repeat protein
VHGAGSGVSVAACRPPRADRRLIRPTLRALAGCLALCATVSAARAEVSPVEVEEASEIGRRAATALLRGERRIFEEATAADSIAAQLVGEQIWRRLSDRQREGIRRALLDRFVETLSPPRGAAGEIAWSSARPEDDSVVLFLGLRYGSGVLKTRWLLTRRDVGWRVEDVLLSDPGISLASEAASSLGVDAIHPRSRAREARRVALPRALGIAAILAVVFFLGRRLAPAGRRILAVIAVAPAVLFAVDGFLSVRRVLSESWVVPEVLTAPAWTAAEREALAAERRGRLDDALRYWERAIAAGAPAAPSDYRLGLVLKAAGRVAEARAAFARARSRSPGAPGASKELGLIALAEGNAAGARDLLRQYLDEAGPDPDAFSALAVAQSNLGEKAEAVASVEHARLLLADRWRGLRLQSQVYARAGDAKKAVAALHALESDGEVDREALRSDPAYLPIATDPAWIGFLAETPVPRK